MEKFITTARPVDYLPTHILWVIGYVIKIARQLAMKYPPGGVLWKQLVVVTVVFIKTAACIRGRAILILEWTFARVILEGGFWLTKYGMWLS